ncbi:acid-sensing ion channel 4-B-like [Pollicipes pollicipes]|uniref:acid-sensing ion channel 4-B-like n=1 Tax=Pollicipes pollicipes TaxID=41117 RepID=UPI00188590F9|nr:acid-sensing ion channel 4-B-like [Pollicipes pollicipes]
MPAIRIICDPAARTWRRVVWLLLLALSVAALVYSVNERLGYLFANPIQMNVKLLVNRTLYFPDLTLCNKNTFNLSAVERLFAEMLSETGRGPKEFGLAEYNRERPAPAHARRMLASLVGHRNRTAADVWRLTQHQLRRLLALDQSPHGQPECFFGRGIQCFDVGNWREVVTVDGICWTYHNNNSMKQTGVYNHLYLQLLDPEPSERQVFGGPGFQLLLHEARDDPRVAVHSRGFLAEPGRATDAEVLLEEVINIPTPAEYGRATEQLERLLADWTGGRCSCLSSCRYIHYEHIVDKIKYERPTARTRVFYNHLFFEQRAEEFSYSTWKMVCDIGGSLGWTCSASILTVFEIAEVIYGKYRARRAAGNAAC